MMRLFVAGLILTGAALSSAPASAQGFSFCKPNANDDRLRPLPKSLVPQAMRLFALHGMTAEQVRHSTVVRCGDGRLLACNAGANLSCGKANVSQTLPAGAAWCRQHPEADFIPAYVTGHDSIYRWRCTQGAPVAGEPVEPVDGRGFIARYWRPIG